MIPITSPKTLGKVLRQYRKLQNLTQKQAGSKLNLTQKTISNIESGKPGVELGSLFKLMAALRLNMTLETRDQNPEDEITW